MPTASPSTWPSTTTPPHSRPTPVSSPSSTARPPLANSTGPRPAQPSKPSRTSPSPAFSPVPCSRIPSASRRNTSAANLTPSRTALAVTLTSPPLTSPPSTSPPSPRRFRTYCILPPRGARPSRYLPPLCAGCPGRQSLHRNPPEARSLLGPLEHLPLLTGPPRRSLPRPRQCGTRDSAGLWLPVRHPRCRPIRRQKSHGRHGPHGHL